VILVSPSNQVLLLHRVQTSSAFPSAHVFPGGNVSAFHDGLVPPPDHPSRHEDGEIYRLAAIRETFEESGILLACNNGSDRLIEVPDIEREAGRKVIHKDEIPFRKWLARKGGRPDIDNLIPFTRWVTPPQVPKRYTTQMYLYFLPISKSGANDGSSIGPLSTATEVVIPPPTHDGGLEHTAARFLSPREWLDLAKAGEVILYPPQYTLLYLISQFLDGTVPNTLLPETLEQQRKKLKEFIRRGDPPWGEACICPVSGGRVADGRQIMSLHSPPPELKGTDRRGPKDYFVLVRLTRTGLRCLDVVSKENLTVEQKGTKL
jgi:hypothetical protein